MSLADFRIKMESERLEWVEIIEPSTKNIMYANLATGQCVWDLPPSVPVKKFDENQWWELFDRNTKRFYYYNATSMKTVWHKPKNCDIIPLAKLQQIKQNTEVHENEKSPKKSTSNQIYKPSSPRKASMLDSITFGGKNSRNIISSTTQTSPIPSPGSAARNSFNNAAAGQHHHHRHHSGSCHHRHQHKQDGYVELDPSSQMRRSSRSSQVSYNKSHEECGRLSDTSSIQSRTSSGRSESLSSSHGGGRSRSHQRRLGPNVEPPSHYSSLKSPDNSKSTPLFVSSSHRRLSNDARHANYITKQHSFDVGAKKVDRPREIPLSRSYSFMSRPKYDSMGMNDRYLPSGMRSVESTPQARRRNRGLEGFPDSPESTNYKYFGYQQRSESSGLENIATPMTHRKQLSLESAKPKPKIEIRPSSSAHTRLIESDSSNSPSSPRREFSPFNFDSPRCPDSGTSTLTDGRQPNGRGSADSSPHSQLDSGLISGTTGSRGSEDSSLKRTLDSKASLDREADPVKSRTDARKCCHHRKHHCVKHKQITSLPQPITTDSDHSDTLQSSCSSLQQAQNSQHCNSSSGSSTTAKQSTHSNCNSIIANESVDYHHHSVDSGKSDKSHPRDVYSSKSDKSHARDASHLYSNLDYMYDQPVYQYIMEQAKISGYKMDANTTHDGDSLHSDNSVDRENDSDDFADDERMSNADSSSQEYLDDDYLADDETYTQFFSRPHVKEKTSGIPTDESDSRVPRPPIRLLANMAISNSTPAPYRNYTPGQPFENQGVFYQPIVINQHNLIKKGPETPDNSAFIFSQAKSVPSPNSILQAKKVLSTAEAINPLSAVDAGGAHMMEKYAQENLNIHTKGILRKKVPVIDMISWTKDPIRKPMLATVDKSLKNQTCEMFKLVQIYMSDRKPKVGMTLNSVGLDIVTLCYNNSGLRDELYVQICRQTTENQNKDSLRRGWELVAICLEFFPPSDKFAPYLSGYISKHCDPAYHTMFPEVSKWPIHIQINHYAGVCGKRLERTSVNAKRSRLKKPCIEEIDLARLHIFRASMFGGTLEEVMALQRDRYPHRKLPWVQTTLSEEILRLQGTVTEGIFRVPADYDEVNQLKQVIDQWEVGDSGDPHVVAALLKLWYRELYQPLIPDSMYASAIEFHDKPSKAVSLINQLPEINRLVLAYLIRFLQYFAQASIVTQTKMDSNNLAMVMAPNCLRCTSDNPKVMYENTRKEMAFIRILIQHLDTTFMEGIV